MVVEVLFLPQLAVGLESRLCIVVDVLRATSTMVTMFDVGAKKVTLAATYDSAISRARNSTPRPLVCGESGGLPPAGFDFGNSPREFTPEKIGGRELIHCTSNGTRAMSQLKASPVVLAGCFLNATAVATRALEKAGERGLDISIVCSGDYLGTRFAIDDAFCAGYLCGVIERQAHPAIEAGQQIVSFHESAMAAMRLYRSYLAEERVDGRAEVAHREATMRAFWDSHNGQVMRKVGLGDDGEYCAQVDITTTVPRLQVEGEELVLYGA